jgi:hypothetical protein
MDERRLESFARGLRELRRKVGGPSYQAMARETGYPAADLATAAAGKELPPLTVTLAYVSVCGGDAGAWADRWWDLAGRPPQPPPPEPDEPVPFPEPAELRQRRRVRVGFVLAGLMIAPLVWTVVVARLPEAPPETVAPWLPAAMPSEVWTGPAPLPPVIEFRAVAGPACPKDFTRQVRVFGENGWREARGGYTVDDCEDRYLYSSYAESYFQWRFMLNGKAARQCVIEVYVPDSANASAPVRYDVADRFENVEFGSGRFMIDQSAARGKWVVGATVALDTSEVLIQIGGSGEGSMMARNSIAAAPLRLTCSRR